MIICLNTAKWFQVFLCHSNNLTSVICLHTVERLYIYQLWVNSLQVILFSNEFELISLHTRIAIVFTQLNGFNYLACLIRRVYGGKHNCCLSWIEKLCHFSCCLFSFIYKWKWLVSNEVIRPNDENHKGKFFYQNFVNRYWYFFIFKTFLS